MTNDEIKKLIPCVAWITRDSDGSRIKIKLDTKSSSITYDHLLALSKAFHTDDINIEYEKGWGGTEVTPGDSPELSIIINNPLDQADSVPKKGFTSEF